VTEEGASAVSADICALCGATVSECRCVDRRAAQAADCVYSDSWAGQTVQQKYKVMSLIARGGMGAVYRARHLQLQVLRALKVLSFDSCSDPDSVKRARQRFLREAQTISSLSHPNIVSCHDFGEAADGTPYVVMDLLTGTTLAALIASGEPLETKRILSIMVQICNGLEHAHERGVLHRDVKPSNVMLVKDEDGRETAKILDFGIAKWADEEESAKQRLTRTGEIIGSAYYISPEQAQGCPMDVRADIYSFGCLLYETLTGTVPFAGESSVDTIVMLLSQEPPALKLRSGGRLPGDLEKLVRRCLEKDPVDRYQNVAALRRDLERIRSGEPIEGPPLGRRVAKLAVRVRRASPVLVSGLAAFVLLSLLFFVARWQEDPAARIRNCLARAVACHTAGKYRQAVVEAGQAIALDPQLAAAYLIRANSFDGLGQWQDALKDCTKAISLDPGNSGAYLKRAFASYKLERYEETLTDAGKAIELDPRLADAYYLRAQGYLSLQRFREAMCDSAKALELDSKMEGPFECYEQAQRKLGMEAETRR
jgi:tetratricopeptide (TPR) repeat protein